MAVSHTFDLMTFTCDGCKQQLDAPVTQTFTVNEDGSITGDAVICPTCEIVMSNSWKESEFG